MNHCMDGEKCTMGGCICNCLDCIDADKNDAEI